MKASRAKWFFIVLMLPSVACADSCFRSMDSVKLGARAAQIAPIGTPIKVARDTLSADCTNAKISEYRYEQDAPLNYDLNGQSIEVYGWLKIVEGPFRFARSVFFSVPVDIEVTIFFDKKMRAIEYESKLYGDSL